ncbi:cobyrinate a,c-diamide synthase [Celeribacter indicus]|uniref:Hydrogenobyrinate a,c-diamide synthase n=1 Tax=Celeribacter indicus TaxID=1208324 RepID=A0A0B5DNQ4_9RHOB|nr:cobyrinate a,c-diamide synthase [Celeribacter indicus]AJE45198.1 cobyrinic acid a,c-diamide synthase [Celeribacter indicus]SDX45113.1 hydrogenobyrinic acid a,c-diamide synthase (glutamine-hydrolysing) /cobyrinate a,c-diamide synthase [Celeribacter indicus]
MTLPPILPPGLMISAPASGTGKTSLMLGLLRALTERGLAVQPFKSGPDYIDPGFHTAASGRSSFNLDSWAMPRGRIGQLLTAAEGADLVLAEGSMGLFDGVARPGECGTGASAEIAAMLGWPVVLVLDVSGQAQSAAAVAQGFARFRPDVRVAGVVLNRVASPRHEALLRAGMEEAGLAVLGVLPRRPDLEMPERHLGLVQASEHASIEDMMAEAGRFIAAHVDLDAVIAAAGATARPAGTAAALRPPGQRIALAQDAAFSFVYPHIVQGWRAAGAEILPFSPLADEAPDAQADICWLPGGYPELHVGRLAAAARFRTGLRRFAETRPVHGECGGYMAMGAALINKDGARHEMAGLLGLVTSYERRKMHLGYRHARLHAPVIGLGHAAGLRGHEFHYSTILEQPDAPLAAVADATGAPVPETGSIRGLAHGTFFHLIGEAT